VRKVLLWSLFRGPDAFQRLVLRNGSCVHLKRVSEQGEEVYVFDNGGALKKEDDRQSATPMLSKPSRQEGLAGCLVFLFL